jgi:hypothetical protein
LSSRYPGELFIKSDVQLVQSKKLNFPFSSKVHNFFKATIFVGISGISFQRSTSFLSVPSRIVQFPALNTKSVTQDASKITFSVFAHNSQSIQSPFIQERKVF